MGGQEDAVSYAREGSAPGWPISLYFHHVHPELQYYTSLTPDDFAWALDTALQLCGPALDPRSLLTLPVQPTEKPVVLITLDDGYRDNMEYALPILDRFGVKALFFAICERVGKTSSPDHNPREEYMTWSDLRHLTAAGHVVGAHTMTHRPLTALALTECQEEASRSLHEVTQQLGTSIVHFAYPYGFVPERLELPNHILAFGTVKAPARPWDLVPHNIRRTYFPTGRRETWRWLAEGWRQQWYTASQ